MTEEPAANLAQPITAPEPVVGQANPANVASQPKTDGPETKAPKFYLEVATFKDESWADNAADKLRQLGFQVLVIHKNLLWAQSYHVEVGPYATQKEVADSRQSLASQGFKAHPVN